MKNTKLARRSDENYQLKNRDDDALGALKAMMMTVAGKMWITQNSV
jgi:hypothetical protein